MPMPWAHRHTTKDWQAFLADAKDGLRLTSDNAAYTAVQGVLLTFRARLSLEQGLRFADLLPAVLRAIFVAGWDVSRPPLPFGPRDSLTAEAQALRPHHNQTPPDCIEAVARALRRQVRQPDFDRLLGQLPEGAVAYWSVPGADPRDLARRIF